ncbi:hypothetical protein NDA16_000809 [Ustilago loliicola]|nr:hypothetical protein NDA16_000809 [Ustilago loliicola]
MPVFVGLGFDIIRTELPPLSSPAGASQLAHICSYGRPLWVSLDERNFWRDAKMKLIGGREESKFDADKIDKLDATLVYNVLASRLALRFVPARGGAESKPSCAQSKLAADLIDRNMCMLEKVVDQHRLCIGTPLEPVLAIAALLLMLPVHARSTVNKQVALHYSKLCTIFVEKSLAVLHGAVLKGTTGELAAQMVMMSACDAVRLPRLIKQARRSAGAASLMERAKLLSEPVQLKELVSQLANLEGHPHSNRVISDCIGSVVDRVQQMLTNVRLPSKRCHDDSDAAAAPSSCPVKAANSLDVRAWINFTHFDNLDKPIDHISSDFLWYCWKRGVAIQMDHQQYGVSGRVPRRSP